MYLSAIFPAIFDGLAVEATSFRSWSVANFKTRFPAKSLRISSGVYPRLSSRRCLPTLAIWLNSNVKMGTLVRTHVAVFPSDSANTFVIGASGVGYGDNLPIATSALVVKKQQVVNMVFDPTALKVVRVMATVRGHIEWIDESDVSVMGQELIANEPWEWKSGQGITNPLTGDPIKEVRISNGTTTAGTISIGVLHDSTP